MVMVPFICSKIKVVNDKIIINNNSVVLKESNHKLEILYNNWKVAEDDDVEVLDKIKDVYSHNSTQVIIICIEFSLALCIAYLLLIRTVLRCLEKLFKNIHDLDSPFTLENVGYIKKMAYLLIAVIILPVIISFIMEFILCIELNISFGFVKVMEILFLFSLVYVFEYGYQIQLESDFKMYGEEK